MNPQDAKGRAGEIALGTPDPLHAWWGLAICSALAAGGWLAGTNSPWLACAAIGAGTGLVCLRRRFLVAAALGTFYLRTDGSWVVRRPEFEAVFMPAAITPWPGAILVDFALGGTRYAMAISPRSAGGEAFRRMQVRVRSAVPAPLA